MSDVNHSFRPYADNPDLCVAEVVTTGETCNRDRAAHVPQSIWDDDPDYPVAGWQDEVANDDTRLGYWQWVEAQREWQSTYDVREA